MFCQYLMLELQPHRLFPLTILRPRVRWYAVRMALWLFFGFILLSATFVLLLSVGPLKAAPNVGMLRLVALVQYAAAAVLAAARVTGKA